jgi:LDH2 family malate/lactate/ureidoglycolate dehydrogenase
MAETQLLDAGRLTEAATAILAALAVPTEDAQLVAQSLVRADLWGHQSHGLLRLPWYARRLQSGAMRAQTQAEKLVDSAAVVVLDGRDGIGQVLAEKAMREALRRAKGYGIGAVAVRNSNHFGTAMFYSLMAPPKGCVAMVFTNASPAMAPWGGREKRVGTNPWSLAAPAGQYAPLVLDIANTAVARGKVYLAKQRGEPIPPGWALDSQGAPTTDPLAAIAGLIAPMAGHKGYGIAVVMDMLAGVLTGSAFGKAVHGPYEPSERSGCGHLMLALDIASFLPLEQFNARMEQLVQELKGTPLAAGSDEIYYPGELEARNAERQVREGLLLPQETVAGLQALADELGLQLALG